jgi:biotin operon repressor
MSKRLTLKEAQAMDKIKDQLPKPTVTANIHNLKSNRYEIFKHEGQGYLISFCPHCFKEVCTPLKILSFLTFNIYSTCVHCSNKYYYKEPHEVTKLEIKNLLESL